MISLKIFESFLVFSVTFALIGSVEIPRLTRGHAQLGHYPFMDMEKCGYISPNDEPRSRIVDGSPATEGEFPWMASLHFKNLSNPVTNDSFICGAVLIHIDWVLTALHCVEQKNIGFNLNSDQLKIHLGSVNKYEYYSIHFVSEIVKNPNGGDVVLLRLTIPVIPVSMANHYVINTICLPTESILNSEDEEALFSGFGASDTKIEIQSPILLKTILIINSYDKCLQMSYTLSEICITESQYMPCPGDSGSGLLQFDGKRAVLIGTFTGFRSYTKDICGPGVSHFMRISFYIDWITFVVGYNSKPPVPLPFPDYQQIGPANEDMPIQSGSDNCQSVLILTLISFLSYILFLKMF